MTEGDSGNDDEPSIVVLLHTLPPGPHGIRAEEAAFRQYNSCVDFTFQERLSCGNARKLKRLNAIFERAADRRSGGIREDRLLRILPSGSAPKYGVDPSAVKRRVQLRREQQEAERAARKKKKRGGSRSSRGSSNDGGDAEADAAASGIAELRVISRGTFLAMFANESTTFINTMGQNEKADRERKMMKGQKSQSDLGLKGANGSSAGSAKQRTMDSGSNCDGKAKEKAQQQLVRVAEPQQEEEDQNQQQVLLEVSNKSSAAPHKQLVSQSSSQGSSSAANALSDGAASSGYDPLGTSCGGGKGRRRKRSSRGSSKGGDREGGGSSGSKASSRRNRRGQRMSREHQSQSSGSSRRSSSSVSSGSSNSSLSSVSASSGIISLGSGMARRGGARQPGNNSCNGNGHSNGPTPAKKKGQRRTDSGSSTDNMFTPVGMRHGLRRSLSEDQFGCSKRSSETEAGGTTSATEGLSPESAYESDASSRGGVAFPVGGIMPPNVAVGGAVPVGGHGADMAGGWSGVISDSNSSRSVSPTTCNEEKMKTKGFPTGAPSGSCFPVGTTSGNLKKREPTREERKALRRERRRKKEEARRIEVARELQLVEEKRRALQEEHAQMVQERQHAGAGHRGVYSGAFSEDEEGEECAFFDSVASALRKFLPSLGGRVSVGVAPTAAIKARSSRNFSGDDGGGGQISVGHVSNYPNLHHRRSPTWNTYDRPVNNNVEHHRTHSMDGNIAAAHQFYSFATPTIPVDLRQSPPTDLTAQPNFITWNASFSSYSSQSTAGSGTLAGESVIVQR